MMTTEISVAGQSTQWHVWLLMLMTPACTFKGLGKVCKTKSSRFKKLQCELLKYQSNITLSVGKQHTAQITGEIVKPDEANVASEPVVIN